MKSVAPHFHLHMLRDKGGAAWSYLSQDERDRYQGKHKSFTPHFQLHAKLKGIKAYTESSLTPEDAVVYHGANERLGLFHATLAEGRANMKLFEENECLISLIANGGTDAAIHIIDRSRDFGIGLDRQDTYKWKRPRSWHERMGVAGHPDFEDRLHWQRDKYLRNTGLILSVKKGWDHASDGGKPWRCSPEELSKKTKMGRVTQALLRNSANPDIQDACGNAALHIAIMHRDVRPIRALKEAGARNDIPNKHGWLPMDLLDLEYEDIGPFLYQQTGNDVNCYIFTLQDRKSWLRAGDAVRCELENWPAKAPLPSQNKQAAPTL